MAPARKATPARSKDVSQVSTLAAILKCIRLSRWRATIEDDWPCFSFLFGVSRCAGLVLMLTAYLSGPDYCQGQLRQFKITVPASFSPLMYFYLWSRLHWVDEPGGWRGRNSPGIAAYAFCSIGNKGSSISNDGIPYFAKCARTLPVCGVSLFLHRQRGVRQYGGMPRVCLPHEQGAGRPEAS